MDLFNYFSDGGRGAELIYPASGAEIDFLHMMVSAQALIHETTFPFNDRDFNDLAGWAGDLQQAISDLQQKQKDYNIADNLNDLTDVAQQIIADKKGKFSINDMLADIDTYNIGVLLNSPSKLSEVLRDYYSDGVYYRYSSFVNNIGGIDELQRRTDRFTTNVMDLVDDLSGIPEAIVKTKILGDEKISEVTDNQLKALNKAFMDYIKKNMEK